MRNINYFSYYDMPTQNTQKRTNGRTDGWMVGWTGLHSIHAQLSATIRTWNSSFTLTRRYFTVPCHQANTQKQRRTEQYSERGREKGLLSIVLTTLAMIRDLNWLLASCKNSVIKWLCFFFFILLLSKWVCTCVCVPTKINHQVHTRGAKLHER